MSLALKRGSDHLFEPPGAARAGGMSSPLGCGGLGIAMGGGGGGGSPVMLKRSRLMPESSAAPVVRRANPDTPFVPRTAAAPLEHFVSPSKRRKERLGSACGVCGAENAVPPMFTVKQVQSMIARAVAERESELKIDFDGILLEKLAEQSMLLAEMSEANIRKQLVESPYTYMS